MNVLGSWIPLSLFYVLMKKKKKAKTQTHIVHFLPCNVWFLLLLVLLCVSFIFIKKNLARVRVKEREREWNRPKPSTDVYFYAILILAYYRVCGCGRFTDFNVCVYTFYEQTDEHMSERAGVRAHSLTHTVFCWNV